MITFGRKTSFVLGMVAGLIVGVLLSGMAIKVSSRYKSNHHCPDIIPVVVAARDIDSGTALTLEMLERQTYVSEDFILCGVSPEEAPSMLGSKTLFPLKKGQIITGFEIDSGPVGLKKVAHDRAPSKYSRTN